MLEGSIPVPSSRSIKRSGPSGNLSSSHISTNDISISSALTATLRTTRLTTSTMTSTTMLTTTSLKTLTTTPTKKSVLSRSMTILTEYSGLVCKKKKISIDSKSNKFELAPDEDTEDESIAADSESDFLDLKEEGPMKTKASLKKNNSSRGLKKLNDSKPLDNPKKLPKAGPFVPLADLVDTDTNEDDDKESLMTAKKHPHPFNPKKFTKAGPYVPLVDLVDTDTNEDDDEESSTTAKKHPHTFTKVIPRVENGVLSGEFLPQTIIPANHPHREIIQCAANLMHQSKFYKTCRDYVEYRIYLLVTCDPTKSMHHVELIMKCPTIRLGISVECFMYRNDGVDMDECPSYRGTSAVLDALPFSGIDYGNGMTFSVTNARILCRSKDGHCEEWSEVEKLRVK